MKMMVDRKVLHLNAVELKQQWHPTCLLSQNFHCVRSEVRSISVDYTLGFVDVLELVTFATKGLTINDQILYHVLTRYRDILSFSFISFLSLSKQ
jgi:hypothetical protein